VSFWFSASFSCCSWFCSADSLEVFSASCNAQARTACAPSQMSIHVQSQQTTIAFPREVRHTIHRYKVCTYMCRHAAATACRPDETEASAQVHAAPVTSRLNKLHAEQQRPCMLQGHLLAP
jgi:hypothetical protein